MMHPWGVCECCGFYFKDQQVIVGSGKLVEFPQQPCICKRGVMDHLLLKPGHTAQWAQMEHETA